MEQSPLTGMLHDRTHERLKQGQENFQQNFVATNDPAPGSRLASLPFWLIARLNGIRGSEQRSGRKLFHFAMPQQA